jgi:hypothetical protein
MAWSQQTEEALHRWLAPETWYKGHPIDDARFSVFVASVWNDAHKVWDEVRTREIIRNKAIELHPGCDDLANEVAERRVSQGTGILDFFSHVKGQFDVICRAGCGTVS